MATVLTLAEVASYLRVHPSTIYRMLKSRTKAAEMLSIFRFFHRERENCGLLGGADGIRTSGYHLLDAS